MPTFVKGVEAFERIIVCFVVCLGCVGDSADKIPHA